MTHHRCPACGASLELLTLEFDELVDRLAGRLVDSVVAVHARLDRITEQLEVLMSDQSHLDTDVEELTTAYALVLKELKEQAVNAGVAHHLDFTAADALVAAAQAEAIADAPTTDAPPTDVPPVADTPTSEAPDSGAGSPES